MSRNLVCVCVFACLFFINIYFFNLFYLNLGHVLLFFLNKANLNNLYVHHTKNPLEKIELVMDRDTFMSAEQALEFGVIDQILTKRTQED